MFFVGFDGKDFECLFFQIHSNAAGALAYSLQASLGARIPEAELLVGMQPAWLRARLERLEETLADLETTASLPLLEPRLLLRLREASKGLLEHAETLRVILKDSEQPRGRKRASRKKE